MTKEYNKPTFFVTEFAANEAVTACNTVVHTEETFTENQTINCFVSEATHNVFVRKNNAGCNENANDAGYLISGNRVTWTHAGAAAAIGETTDWWDPAKNGKADDSRWYFFWEADTDDKSAENVDIFTDKDGDDGLFDQIFKLLGLTEASGWHLGFATSALINWATHS